MTSRNALQTQLDNNDLLAKRKARLSIGISLVQTQLDKAELDLQRTTIHAPIDGVVTMEAVEQDGYVTKGATIITLQGTDSLDVACKLHMRQMHWLWQQPNSTSTGVESWQAYAFPATNVDVIYELGGAGYSWAGQLKRYDSGGVDATTRMVPCRVH
ncbi:MAG: hypothetical protein KDA51_19455, partial [Planctomycetales bacterium]|nr:hypothetical protein [Planctomycetales bacterium]